MFFRFARALRPPASQPRAMPNQDGCRYAPGASPLCAACAASAAAAIWLRAAAISSSLVCAEPHRPQPPSGASVSNTHIRAGGGGFPGAPETRAVSRSTRAICCRDRGHQRWSGPEPAGPTGLVRKRTRRRIHIDHRHSSTPLLIPVHIRSAKARNPSIRPDHRALTHPKV